MILITGATGKTGSALVDELAGRADLRTFVRTEAAAQAHRERGIESFVGRFEDEASLRSAAAGATSIFVVSPPGAGDMVAAQTAVLGAAVHAGATHIVKVSSIAAEHAPTESIIRAHRTIEEKIESTGVNWTHLRPNWFMQNELGQATSIRSNGEFYAPDMTAVAMIDARDIAAAAAAVLLAPEQHHGRGYTLSGPEALSYAEIATIYGQELGREVRWHEVTLEDAHASMVDSGLPDELARGFVEVTARYRRGGLTSTVVPDLPMLIGRRPRSFAEFVRDHRKTFA